MPPSGVQVQAARAIAPALAPARTAPRPCACWIAAHAAVSGYSVGMMSGSPPGGGSAWLPPDAPRGTDRGGGRVHHADGSTTTAMAAPSATRWNADTPLAATTLGGHAAAVGTTATRTAPSERGARSRMARRTSSSPGRNSPPPWSATGPVTGSRRAPRVGRDVGVGRRDVLHGWPAPLAVAPPLPRPPPRPRNRPTRSGAATNGARYATSRIGTRTRVATGADRDEHGQRPEQHAPAARSSEAPPRPAAGVAPGSGRAIRGPGRAPAARAAPAWYVSGSCCDSGVRPSGPKIAMITTTQPSVTRIGFRRPGKLLVTYRVRVAPQLAQGAGQRARRVPLGDRLEPGRQGLGRHEDVRDERDREDDREDDLVGRPRPSARTGPARSPIQDIAKANSSSRPTPARNSATPVRTVQPTTSR